jgi:hypothetical protein
MPETMSNRILLMIVKAAFLCLFSAGLVAAQAVQRYVAEGMVVAFQKNNRCPTCEGKSRSIALPFENWIVRIDKWDDEKFSENEFILVNYQMYDRSLSESEIHKKLKFVLRERGEHEQNHDCVGNVSYKKGEHYFLRPAEFGDYGLTEPDKIETIPPDFKKLPCFIVEELPTVVK